MSEMSEFVIGAGTPKKSKKKKQPAPEQPSEASTITGGDVSVVEKPEGYVKLPFIAAPMKRKTAASLVGIVVIGIIIMITMHFKKKSSDDDDDGDEPKKDKSKKKGKKKKGDEEEEEVDMEEEVEKLRQLQNSLAQKN